MKKRIFTLMLLLVAVTFAVEAHPVDMTTASEVAIKFMKANAKVPLRGAEDLQLVTTYNISRGDAAFYIFNTPNGFVIVSADDCATPILGYSNEGKFDVENIPIQLQHILQGYVDQIQYGIENHLNADEQTAQQWELVRATGWLKENRDGVVVEPLITTTWSQGCYYNAMCPVDDDGPCNHVYTGCTATAMAQIMYYWGYPEHGTGSHSYTPYGYPEQNVDFAATTYDWENMPNSLNASSSSEQIDAVATLMWHCGVSLNMYYGPSASAGEDPDYALKDYFDYSDDMHFEYKQNDESWVSLLKTDLNAGRPVYYGAFAHALICDGYDANDRFHFNFGWGGYSDGYYVLDDITYYRDDCAIFNIHPNAGSSHQVTALVNPFEGGGVTGAGMYGIGSVCTLTATANEGYTFMYWTEEDEVVSTQAEYSFSVRKDRELVAHFATPFHIEVVSDSVEGGTVSGQGDYVYGSTCTLTAIPNEGYDFICWRRPNGTVVTTSPTCSFTVTEATTLTAVFAVSGGEQIAFADLVVKALCVAHWDTNGDGELSYAEAAAVTNLGTVFRENTEITSFEELQYFTGLTTIGNSAFSGCRNLSGALNIPNSVTSIGNYAFYNCSGFTGSLVIGNAVTTIGYYAFKNCSGFTGSLVIGNAVTIINFEAFRNCSGFTGSLTIPNSVTTIGNWAFQNCSGFTGDLNIPDSVTTIGIYAFENCTGFTGSLTIGNSVAEIGNQVFRNCNGFKGSLTIGGSVTTIDYAAFYGCRRLSSLIVLAEMPPALDSDVFYLVDTGIPVCVPCENVESYSTANWGGFSNIIGMCGGVVTVVADPNEGGTVIGGGSYEAGQTCTVIATANEGYVFANWIHDGMVVSNSGEYTFYVTDDMTMVAQFVSEGNIVFADANVKSICVSHWDTNGDGELSYVEAASVTSLGLVFMNRTDITSFEELQYFINLTSIGKSAFSGCSGLTGNLIIPNSVTTIGNWAFQNCSGLTGDLNIPNSVTSIGSYAFKNCSGFTGSLNIGNSVTIIYFEAFRNCSGFTGDLIIGNSVTTISSSAFHNCSGFTGDLIIGNSVTTISSSAFRNCSGFTGSLTIPNSVTTIGSQAFYNCSGFTGSLTIGNSVTTVDNYAFMYCSGFTGSLIIPNSVTTIGNSAFYNCSGFTGCLTIPNSVTTIGSQAFYNCSGFTGNLTIGNSVATIGTYAFRYCGNFTLMKVLPETPPTVVENAFHSSFYGIPVHVPCGSLAVYQGASGWSSFTNYHEDCMQALTITLSSGANWFSTNFNITLADLKAALVAAAPGTAITIQSQTLNTSYNPNNGRWTGQLTTLDVTRMCVITVTTDCEMVLNGLPVNPAEHPVTIASGANWIAYPLGQSMTLTDAVDGFAVNGDVVQSQTTNASYIRNRWQGQLTELVPGKGYVYNSSTTESRVFTFPTGAK